MARLRLLRDRREPSRSQLPALLPPAFSDSREAPAGSGRPAVAAGSLPISVVIESLFVFCGGPHNLKEVPHGRGYCLSLELLLIGSQKQSLEGSSLMVPGTTSQLQAPNYALEMESWREGFLKLSSVQPTQQGKLGEGSMGVPCSYCIPSPTVMAASVSSPGKHILFCFRCSLLPRILLCFRVALSQSLGLWSGCMVPDM